jgi:hypothetical protein
LKPFRCIGYHNVILNAYPFDDGLKQEVYDGMIHPGRPLGEPGAHVRGYNEDSIGICMIGIGKGIGKFTHKQLRSARWLIQTYMDTFDVPLDMVQGHCELDPVDKGYCPGIDMDSFRLFMEDYSKIKLFDVGDGEIIT